jgi:hypothetical protein
LWLIVFALLLSHIVRLSDQAWRMSPTITEVSHLGAISYYWTMGYYDVFPANPPETRIIAGFPWYLSNPTNDFGSAWNNYSRNPADRCEYAIGMNYVIGYHSNNAAIQWDIWTYRIFLIPLIVLGGYIGFKFAAELHGAVAGLFFLMLWVYSPLVLGWGATLCTDVPAAAMGIIAFYAFWHWFKTPTICKTILTGVLLGLLPYTKLTWLIAFPIFLVLYLYKRRIGDAPPIKLFLIILVLSVATINVGYWFDGSFTLLKDYQFVSGALTGHYIERGEEVIQGNRFAGSLLGYIPIPFPYDFIRGIDTQKLDFERGFTSYAAGLVSNHGWWWYYGYALFFKEFIITWIMLIVAIVFMLWFCDFRKWDDVFILVPAIILFVFISSQTGFSEHPRYAIPMLPFVYLFISRLGNYLRSVESRRILVGVLCFICIIIYLGLYCRSVDCKYPLVYFNFVAKENKSQYLLGSNIDWGQSAYEIRDWCNTHCEARPRYINYTRSMPFDRMAVRDDGNFPEYERKPGWMIISVNDIYNKKYQWILKEKPVEILGNGSVFIYYLEPQ